MEREPYIRQNFRGGDTAWDGAYEPKIPHYHPGNSQFKILAVREHQCLLTISGLVKNPLS